MVSTLKGPIPSHPMFDVKGNSSAVSCPVPRVRPEAQGIAAMHQGSVGLVLQIDGRGLGRTAPKTKPQPRNHLNENVRRMRQIQKQSKQRQEQHTQPVKALWQSEQYAGVTSKIADILNKEPLTPRPHSADFLRSHSRTGFIPSPKRPQSAEPPVEKLTVPRASSAREVKLVRHDIDFVKHNGRSARKTAMYRSPSLTALDDLKSKKEEEQRNYHRGAVPKYLQKRQKQWEEEEEYRRLNAPDPNMPPGHKVLDETERKETLEKLNKSLEELTRRLRMLPIRTDTLRVQNQRKEIESKMAEVEEAVKIFSRPKVYVRIDD